MPNVSLLFGNHWFEMFVEDYIYVSKDVCKVCVYGNADSESRWIIGNSFMRGYYVTHDLENLSFGIAPQDNRYKPKGYSADFPYQELNPNTFYLWLALSIFGSIVGLLLITILILPTVVNSQKVVAGKSEDNNSTLISLI